MRASRLIGPSLAVVLGVAIGLSTPAFATTINLGSSQDASIADIINFPFGAEPDFMINWSQANSSLGLIQFDLSAIPSGATINSATLTLFHQFNLQPGITFDFLRNTSAWDENTTTYATRPTTAAGVVSSLTISDMNDHVFRSWDLTAVTQSWVDGVVNDGLTLQRVPDQNPWPYFMSKEAPDESQRPLLTIDFTATPSEVPEPWSMLLLALAGGAIFLFGYRRTNRLRS